MIAKDEEKVFVANGSMIFLVNANTMNPIEPRFVKSITDLAWDWISGNLYVVDDELDRVSVLLPVAKTSSPDFTTSVYQHTVMVDNFQRPRFIEVDPVAGFVFCADVGSDDGKTGAKIERSILSGEFRQTIVDGASDTFGISAFTIDTINQRLFWFDSKRRAISSSNYDGLRMLVFSTFI